MGKLIKSLMIILALISIISCPETKIHNGDIIFQISKSAQSIAIQKATGSQYSHMGIVYISQGKKYVYEAVGPVKLTPFSEWVARGENGHYVIKRLKNYEQFMTAENQQKFKDSADRFTGLPYDTFFLWSDESIYCSELVWKLYYEALNIELAPLKKMEQFDLTSPEVQKIMAERFSEGIPVEEPVMSPADIFDSEKLMHVFEKN